MILMYVLVLVPLHTTKILQPLSVFLIVHLLQLIIKLSHPLIEDVILIALQDNFEILSLFNVLTFVHHLPQHMLIHQQEIV